jgi:hypothetical protein
LEILGEFSATCYAPEPDTDGEKAVSTVSVYGDEVDTGLEFSYVQGPTLPDQSKDFQLAFVSYSPSAITSLWAASSGVSGIFVNVFFDESQVDALNGEELIFENSYMMRVNCSPQLHYGPIDLVDAMGCSDISSMTTSNPNYYTCLIAGGGPSDETSCRQAGPLSLVSSPTGDFGVTANVCGGYTVVAISARAVNSVGSSNKNYLYFSLGPFYCGGP